MKPPSQPPATSPSRRPSPEASEGVLPRRSIIQRVLAYRRLWILATVVYVLDQLTKGWIAGRLNYPTYGPPFHLPVIDGFFNLVHVGNTGAAWSILSGYGRLLGGFALLTLVAIFFWRKMLGLRNPTVQWCFGGLCGGTVGNLTDRFRYGHVVDFLDFRFGSYAYPSFNVADMGIV
ncbi:MAG: signal peptidase II, partial [Candidatus Didemnitutus sp.]|nr:signal peptidase II [Candidatus Didemnitutus sp.]